MNAIVTNAKNRIAYNVVKSLGEKGIDVFTSDSIPLAMSFSSRFVKGHFVYPSPYRLQDQFIRSMVENIKRVKADVLIPTYEETYLISKYKSEFERYVKLVVPDYEQILIAHNKDRWEKLAIKLGIPTPRTYSIEDVRDGKIKLNESDFPILLKPKQGGGASGIEIVKSQDELQCFFRTRLFSNFDYRRFFVQEQIDGNIQCVAMLFRKGEYRARVAYEQIRDFPATGGQATIRRSIHNEKAEAYLASMLRSLNWHGICQADFVIEKKTGIPFLIDLNPRFWGSLVQGLASGVDFPFLVYKMAIDGDVETVNGFVENITTRWIGGDIRGFPQYLKMRSDKFRFIKEFCFANWWNVRFDDFDIRDPLPFLTWCLDSASKMIGQRTFSPAAHESLEGIWQ
jgi:predicted ATP-grasp superfamily ATP-dependent carboligase